MKAANFNVIGDPDKMFASASDEKKKSNYLIGGQIDDIKLEICEEINWWTGLPRGTQKGKGAVRVRWQVFSVLTRKVVFETTTQGAAKLEMGVGGGEMVLIHNAFGNAVQDEYPLHDPRSAEDRRNAEANHGDNRYERVLQRMSVHNHRRRQSLGMGCPDIVLTDNLQHR